MARLPKPFQRPAMSLEIPGAKREWQKVDAYQVRLGDIVQGTGRGLVVAVEHDDAVVRLWFKNGSVEKFFHDTELTAFSEVGRGNSI